MRQKRLMKFKDHVKLWAICLLGSVLMIAMNIPIVLASPSGGQGIFEMVSFFLSFGIAGSIGGSLLWIILEW